MIGQTLGGFEIIEEIGRGGMGVVYRARQISLGKTVAVKALPAQYAADDRATRRFIREAHNMARLRHPNIVDVIDVGEEDGVRYFAMQYVEGESLASLIQREGALPPDRVAELGAQIADALGHAHDRGVIHRDVKPANILVDEHGRAVVTDFGIAKTAEGLGLTTEGMVIGVPEYMSPEVVRGNPVDGRSDVYSLGVVLYQMATGRVPFTATTPVAVAMKHVNDSPPPPGSMGAGCPPWLESIILRALAKQPADRFSSAQEMATALRAAAPVGAPTQEVPARVAEAGVSQTEAPKRSHLSSTVILATALAVLGIGLIVVGAGLLANRAWVSVGRIPGWGVTKTVPSVTGMAEAEADRALRDAGFRSHVRDRRYSLQYPERTVVEQRPGGNSDQETGAVVEIVVSLGDPSHEIEQAIEDWESAEETGTVGSYMAYYSESARIYSNDKWWGWVTYRDDHEDKIGPGCGRIEVSHGAVSYAVLDDGQTIRASFHRSYNRQGGPRGSYRARGRQELDYRMEGGRWLIVRDHFEED